MTRKAYGIDTLPNDSSCVNWTIGAPWLDNDTEKISENTWIV